MLAPLLALLFSNLHPVAIGDAAPATALRGMDGQAVAVADGQDTAVSFFATWCGPCHRVIADLLAIRDSRPTFRIVLVAVAETPSHVAAFLKAQAIPADTAVALDVTGAAARAWGQDRFPTTFLVDKRKVIRHINRGYGPGFRARVDKWLRTMHEAE